MILFAALWLGLVGAQQARAMAPAPLELDLSSAKAVAKAQKSLAKWVKLRSKEAFSGKVDAMVRRQLIAFAPERGEVLRDAVASRPTFAVARKPVPCETLEVCAQPPLMTQAAGVAEIGDAVAFLLRPWLLLQARRSGTAVVALSAKDDALLEAELPGIVPAPLELRASPAPGGGLQIWLSSQSDLEGVYAYSREAALRPQ